MHVEAEVPTMSLVYDVGMFNGDDTAYYLEKGFRVVGVEANPNLISRLKERFSAEIEQKRLVIENVAVVGVEGEVELFIAGDNKPQSSLTRRVLDLHNVPATSTRVRGLILSSLVQRHGTPAFMKIDVENSDLIALRDLASHGIKPPDISVEAHEIAVIGPALQHGLRTLSLYQRQDGPHALCKCVRAANRRHSRPFYISLSTRAGRSATTSMNMAELRASRGGLVVPTDHSRPGLVRRACALTP